MGEPKLLLPLGSQTVIARLLRVFSREEIADCIVVVRGDDTDLRDEVLAAGVTLVQLPIDPPDMRSSVEHALAEIRRRYSPTPDDGWILVPADHPMLEPAVLDQLIEHWSRSDCSILVPTHESRRGHPTFFRWSLAEEVPLIPPDQGINWLLKTHSAEVAEVAVDDPAILIDLDTPEDYQSLLQRCSDGSE